MMNNDLQKRVQDAAQGITPQTMPDQRRRFLGSLRERVLVRMSIADCQNPALTTLFLKHMNDYAGYSILINGKMPQTEFINQLQNLASQTGIDFTMVNNETAQTAPEATAILVVAKTAINQLRIELTQVYPPEIPKQTLDQPKRQQSFWHKLFGGNK